MIPLRKSTDGQVIGLGPFTDSVDGDTEENSLSIANTDIKLMKHGATTLTNKSSGGATVISNGVYYATLNQADTNTAGRLDIFCHPAGAGPTRLSCVVLPQNMYDSLYAGTAGLPSEVASGVVASSASATQLTASIATFGELDGCLDGAGIVITESTGSGSFMTTVASSVAVGGAVSITLSSPCPFAIDLGSTVKIYPPAGSGDSAATIWAALTSGFTVAGSAGKLLNDNLDAKVSEAGGGGGGTVSPYLVDDDHTWRFTNRSEITSPVIIQETVGFDGLLQLDFSETLPANAALQSITTASVADVVGATEPTISSSALSADKQKVVMTVNATSATASTYTFSVKVLTTDSQSFTRKGRLTLQ